MKGLGVRVLPLLAGFRTDVERLLKRFHQMATMRFLPFKECFREMKFAFIYRGRETEAELREFEEGTLTMALSYCLPRVAPHSRDQVAGIYLLYSLYHIQPLQYRAPIRATLDQMRQMMELNEQLRDEQQHEAVYCLQRLFADQAFVVCAYNEEMHPLFCKRYDNTQDVTTGLARADVQSSSRDLDDLVSGLACQQVELIHTKYKTIKEQLFGDNAATVPAELSSCDTSIVDVCKEIVQRCHDKMQMNTGSPRRNALLSLLSTSDGRSSQGPIKNNRMALKQKAYRQVARQARHRRYRQQDAEIDRIADLPSPSSSPPKARKSATCSSAIVKEEVDERKKKRRKETKVSTKDDTAAAVVRKGAWKKVVAPKRRKKTAANEQPTSNDAVTSSAVADSSSASVVTPAKKKKKSTSSSSVSQIFPEFEVAPKRKTGRPRMLMVEPAGVPSTSVPFPSQPQPSRKGRHRLSAGGANAAEATTNVELVDRMMASLKKQLGEKSN